MKTPSAASPCGSQAACYRQALNIENAALNLSNYSPNLFPLSGTEMILNISITVLIYKLLNLGNDKTLSLSMEVDLMWLDPNLPGNWSLLPNNTQLFIDASSVWTMNLYIVNPADSNLYLSPDNLVYLFPPPEGSTGAMVQGSIIQEFSSSCDSMDLIDFPFDSQTCTMTLEYGDSINIANVQFLLPAQLYISNNPGNSEWTIKNVTTLPSPSAVAGDIYYGMDIVMSFTRKSYYYNVFLVIPIVLLLSVGVLTVILPSDRGEKVVLGATLVIAMYVLFASITQQIPQIEDNHVPRIVTALEIGTLMNAIALAEAVVIQTLRIVAHDLPGDVHRMLDPTLWIRFFSHGCKAFRKQSNDPHKQNSYQNNHNNQYKLFNQSNHVNQYNNVHYNNNNNNNNNNLSLSNQSNQNSQNNSNSGAQTTASLSILPDFTNNSFSDLAQGSDEFRVADDFKSPAYSDAGLSFLVPLTPEYSLVQRMLVDFAQKDEKVHIRTVWRKLEYFVNFLTFSFYVGLLIYYFGSFIYINP